MRLARIASRVPPIPSYIPTSNPKSLGYPNYCPSGRTSRRIMQRIHPRTVIAPQTRYTAFLPSLKRHNKIQIGMLSQLL